MKRVKSRKILVVDDEEEQRHLFCRRLRVEGFEVFVANSGSDALPRIRALHPDLVLADISMPEIDGIQMLKIMRQVPNVATTPVILMTGMPIPESLLQAAADGLKAGPIHVKGDFKALLVRITNIFKASAENAVPSEALSHVFCKGPVSADLIQRTVIVAGRQVPHLTTKLFDLLVALLRHDGLVDQDVLLNEVWGHKSSDTKLVKMTMARLREALRGFPALQIRTDAHSYELLTSPFSTKVNR